MEAKNILVAFGGERDCDPDLDGEATGAHKVLDDIMVFDVEFFLWYPPAATGKPPSPRAGHSACLMGSNHNADLVDLVIFGGTTSAGKILSRTCRFFKLSNEDIVFQSAGRRWENSVHVLNCNLWEWSAPKVQGRAPCARTYHSATPIDGGRRMVIFGGNSDSQCFNDVYVLSINNEASKTNSCACWEWSKPHVLGDAPLPRTGHGACLLADGKTLFVHGGWDPQDETKDEVTYYSDAFLLDTELWGWRPVELVDVDVTAMAVISPCVKKCKVQDNKKALLKVEYTVSPINQNTSQESILRSGWTGHSVESGKVIDEENSSTIVLYGGQGGNNSDRRAEMCVCRIWF